MTMRVWVLGIVVLVAACSEKRPPPPPPPPLPKKPAKVAPPETKPPKPSPAQKRRARRAELWKQKAALEAQIAELEQARAELVKRQEEERAGLPQVDLRIRQRFMRYTRDARDAAHKLELMERRIEELEQRVAGAMTGKLKELREQRAEVEQRQNEILNAWQRSLEEASLGKVEESPVKQDLDLVRAVKRQWFAVSVPARRGRVKFGEKTKINKGFRAWLAEVPARKQIVAQALAWMRGRRRSPDAYDYTNLDFYVLLELLEDDLDRKNVAVEQTELKKNRARLDRIRRELDAVEQQISDQMAEGGDELSEYDDLLDRLPDARENASHLATRVEEWAGIFRELEAFRARQLEEEDALLQPLREARRELKLVQRELRPLGR
ncbi:MAG: hypothetical protein ACYTEZ_11770 [Planctomycetota bacterium]